MINAILNGGVGNQLFEIATTYALALDNGDECAFNFDVECKNQGNSPRTYRDTLYKKLKELPKEWKPKAIYKEQGYKYQHIPYQEGLQLKGYFARERYFIRHRQAIIDLLRDKQTVDNLKSYHEDILHNSVSIHVRRGDYTKFDKVYHILPTEYYGNALKYLEKQHTIDNILIFSDEIEWCMENMKPDKRNNFIISSVDYQELLLMGLCTHNIIANSTFSFWGAWLGEEALKTVIAPALWFKDEGLNDADIVPIRWHKIHSNIKY